MSDDQTPSEVAEDSSVDSQILEVKERLKALRRQVREETDARTSASSESAKEAQLNALQAEEHSLEMQLSQVRSVQMPGADPNEGVVPAEPEEGRVNVDGEPVRAAQDPLAEGVAFREVVDQQGNLVRQPINEEGEPQGEPQPVQVTEEATVESTREADAPPPTDEPEARLGRNRRR
jgi:hypothetical protein